ncbi:CIC11C00000004572 [Sungouiella intermedia]|uniref:CIC11C00000004572 n=1 Tax=Sungouiella intermedia TaxID=45354 RepID=A0A1L0DAU0_9ASCO|nr:CIC11C00000004572 [[Candida] intermedia]
MFSPLTTFNIGGSMVTLLARKQYLPSRMAGSFGVRVFTEPFSVQFSPMVQLSDIEMLLAPLMAARRDMRLPVAVSIQSSMKM